MEQREAANKPIKWRPPPPRPSPFTESLLKTLSAVRVRHAPSEDAQSRGGADANQYFFYEELRSEEKEKPLGSLIINGIRGGSSLCLFLKMST